jgi:hypothetical protein
MLFIISGYLSILIDISLNCCSVIIWSDHQVIGYIIATIELQVFQIHLVRNDRLTLTNV